MIKNAETNFNKLLESIKKENPQQEQLEEYTVDPKEEQRSLQKSRENARREEEEEQQR